MIPRRRIGDSRPDSFEASSILTDAVLTRQDQQIKEIFELFDKDGGGTIDKKELHAAMYALGFHRSCDDGRNSNGSFFLKEHDSTWEGSICLEEFSALMKGELTGQDPLDMIKTIFSALSCSTTEMEHYAEDDQYPDLITFPKLQRACRQFHVRLTDDELRLIHKAADRDGGGTVDLEEFIAIMMMSAWF